MPPYRCDQKIQLSLMICLCYKSVAEARRSRCTDRAASRLMTVQIADALATRAAGDGGIASLPPQESPQQGHST